MGKQRRKPTIFIAYQSSERRLADSLWALFRAWGCKPFHCRHEQMDNAFYRKQLRKQLRECDLVVLLLSPEFQWSQYCQAEAGTTMALNKAFIPIIVAPATKESINRDIAQVLEGCDFINSADVDFIAKLNGRVSTQLRKRKAASRKVMARLARLANDRLEPLEAISGEEEEALADGVAEAVAGIDRRYRLHQPPRKLFNVWPSLRDEGCFESIVGNIVHSLNSPLASTDLVFVGVSLKYSLHCIRAALERVNRLHQGESPPKKKLAITMVHMDEQAHILHALNLPDIKIIKDNFVKDWPNAIAKWKTLCEANGIELVEPKPIRIDYLPPMVGILIDDSILYAGRCAFHRHGSGEHAPLELWVGELPYFFYRIGGHPTADAAAINAIREFKACLQAYHECTNNSGVVPVWTSDTWIDRLRGYCLGYDGEEAITFISGTAAKFEPLIRGVLEKGRTRVSVYVHDAETPSQRIRAVQDNVLRNMGRIPETLEIRCYPHAATFRAAVIGSVAIGLQTYVSEGAEVGGTARKLQLCSIVTPCFEHFSVLKHSILTFADRGATSDT
jgi:hypothetical protein